MYYAILLGKILRIINISTYFNCYFIKNTVDEIVDLSLRRDGCQI